jgi:hypothetical protein
MARAQGSFERLRTEVRAYGADPVLSTRRAAAALGLDTTMAEPRSSRRMTFSRSSLLVVVVSTTLALGAAVLGCGPQKKFCPETPNGVCPETMDASGDSIYIMMDVAEEERGSIYVGSDAQGN